MTSLVALASAGLALAACSTSSTSAPSSTKPTQPTPSTSATGSATPSSSSRGPKNTNFHVTGNEVVAPNGTQFIPYGFVVECLASIQLSCEQSTAKNPVTDSDRIMAAAQFWRANTIRLQVSQEHLFSKSPYDAAYLQQVDDEVHEANALGMVAIVTLQEEEYNGPPLPTATAVRFWRLIARHYAGNPMVFFDLYNEPRLKPFGDEDWMWNIWRNGGSVDVKGVNYTFVGMQSLVNDIRSENAQNIIVAEGNKGDHDLSELPNYELTGSNIAYGMEPDLTATTDNPTEWDAAYGNLSNSVPIMMEAFQDYATAGTCFTDSPSVLPELLNYLMTKHLGLISWALNPGNMMVGENPEDPTSYNGSNTQICVPHNKKHQVKPHLSGDFSLRTNNNGPGATILAFFRANSQKVEG